LTPALVLAGGTIVLTLATFRLAFSSLTAVALALTGRPLGLALASGPFTLPTTLRL